MHPLIKDQALWLQIKQGNGLALVQLYDQYVDVLYSYGRKFTTKAEIIEDAIQDLLTELWLRRDKIRVPDSVKAYLLKAFRQKLFRQLSRYQRISFIDEYPQTIHDESEDYLPSQDLSDLEIERRLSLKKSLATLSPKQQEAIMLRYTENLTHEEIAEIMEIKKQSLYNLLHTAVQKLSKSMREKQKAPMSYFLLALALLSVSFTSIF